MSDAPKVEEPVVAAPVETPAVVEPVVDAPAAEMAAPEVATEAPAAEAAAAAEETPAAAEATPVEEGVLGYKGPGLLKYVLALYFLAFRFLTTAILCPMYLHCLHCSLHMTRLRLLSSSTRICLNRVLTVPPL